MTRVNECFVYMPLVLSNHAPKQKNIEGQHHSLLVKGLVLIDLVFPEARGTRIFNTTLDSGKVHMMSPEGL